MKSKTVIRTGTALAVACTALLGSTVKNTKRKMKTITKNQHLQLVGLLTLAGRHMKMLESISEAALAITCEKEKDGTISTCGHTSDAIFDDNRRDADALLTRLEIKVRK